MARTEMAPLTRGARKDPIDRDAVLVEIERVVDALRGLGRAIRATEHLRGSGEHL